MVTKRKKRVHALRSDVPAGTVHLLETGEDGSDFDLFLAKWNREILKGMWIDLKDEILADWITRKPGTRPWAWWKCEAPEPRREIGQNKSGAFRLGEVYVRGLPFYSFPGGQFDLYEGEASYLVRIGALTPAEKRRLKKKDFTPEKVETDNDDDHGDRDDEVNDG